MVIDFHFLPSCDSMAWSTHMMIPTGSHLVYYVLHEDDTL